MNLGFGEMLFLFVLGLLLFGPKKLPTIGRQLGKAMNDFKRASQEFQSQLNDEVRQLEEAATRETEPQPNPPTGTAARGDYVDYAMEPSSGENEAEGPARGTESVH